MGATRLKILLIESTFRIEIEDEATKRHKWNCIVSKADGKATVMLIEFAGRFTNYDKKLCSDTNKVCRNAARLLNNKDSTSSHQPGMLIVLSHGYKIYSECLALVANHIYVRTPKAVLNVPCSLYGLKIAMPQFPDMFAWCNAVISSVQEKVPCNNNNLETIPVSETP
ncbi:hypothetical protein CU097_007581 [Rhizopus azygosporus]|uniref:Uncharacterized protein n=2 Tax=Rhizopus TaxID=4842 RepID=A0A367J2Q3_RHIAZ|nr:hypothetical protein CU097_007581 [Rhizopus azygosporus]